MNHPDPVATVTLCQGDDPFAQLQVAIRPWPITQSTRAHAHHAQTASLREAFGAHPPHQLPPSRCA
jgi:hypothetical protein